MTKGIYTRVPTNTVVGVLLLVDGVLLLSLLATTRVVSTVGVVY